jgi:hypothetical protein
MYVSFCFLWRSPIGYGEIKSEFEFHLHMSVSSNGGCNHIQTSAYQPLGALSLWSGKSLTAVASYHQALFCGALYPLEIFLLSGKIRMGLLQGAQYSHKQSGNDFFRDRALLLKVLSQS